MNSNNMNSSKFLVNVSKCEQILYEIPFVLKKENTKYVCLENNTEEKKGNVSRILHY